VNRGSELEAAFDAALSQARNYLKAGMTTRGGQDGGPYLEKLEQELERERQRAVGGAVDRDWVQRTVRWLVEWVPDTELTLIAALGRIARAGPNS
jgi:hypothetical protein